jgi:hypothetical protein
MPPRAYDPYRDHEHVNAFPIQTRGMITAASACCEIRNGILSEDSRNNGGAGLGGAQNGHRNFFMCCAGTVRVRVRYGTAINGRYASYGSQGVWVANKDCMSCCFGMINYRSDYRTGITVIKKGVGMLKKCRNSLRERESSKKSGMCRERY